MRGGERWPIPEESERVHQRKAQRTERPPTAESSADQVWSQVPMLRVRSMEVAQSKVAERCGGRPRENSKDATVVGDGTFMGAWVKREPA